MYTDPSGSARGDLHLARPLTPSMQMLEPAECPLPDALALGPALLARAEREGMPQVAASLVRGPAVILGAVQRAGRVVDLAWCAHAGVTVLRRSTTGAAAWLGGLGFVFTVALPHVAALFPDATPRTLLNRNVRAFLKGFSRAGAMAHYFGRDFISLRQRPAVLLGFDVTRSGAVLIEAFAGHDEAVALPDAAKSPAERAITRWSGKPPAAVSEVLRGARPEDVARAVLEGFTARVRQERTSLTLAPEELDLGPFQPIHAPRDPVPDGLLLGAPVPVPIGWIEAAADLAARPEGRRVWVGGDVLAPRWALVHIAEALGGAADKDLLGDVAIEGATTCDLLQAVGVALGEAG
jgi:lipoate-protein ligase A